MLWIHKLTSITSNHNKWQCNQKAIMSSKCNWRKTEEISVSRVATTRITGAIERPCEYTVANLSTPVLTEPESQLIDSGPSRFAGGIMWHREWSQGIYTSFIWSSVICLKVISVSHWGQTSFAFIYLLYKEWETEKCFSEFSQDTYVVVIIILRDIQMKHKLMYMWQNIFRY